MIEWLNMGLTHVSEATASSSRQIPPTDVPVSQCLVLKRMVIDQVEPGKWYITATPVSRRMVFILSLVGLWIGVMMILASTQTNGSEALGWTGKAMSIFSLIHTIHSGIQLISKPHVTKMIVLDDRGISFSGVGQLNNTPDLIDYAKGSIVRVRAMRSMNVGRALGSLQFTTGRRQFLYFRYLPYADVKAVAQFISNHMGIQYIEEPWYRKLEMS